MLNNIDKIIRRESLYAIKAVLEGSLTSSDQDEKSRQEDMIDALKQRGLDAPNKQSSEKKEAEDESSGTDDTSEKDKQEDRTGGKGTADSPKLKTPKPKEIEAPTVGSIIDKLNALRGGKSLKDPEVKKSFSQYFDGLTEPERQTLLVFLTGIAQILAGTKTGSEAIEPSDIGVKSKATEKNLGIDTKKRDKKKPEGSADNPIVVGEVSREKMKKAIQAYKKYQ